jgi:hypothetical protein
MWTVRTQCHNGACLRQSRGLNVWCPIILDLIIGPFFFIENAVMCQVYLDMLENFVFPQIAEVDGHMFQQNGASPHFGAIVLTALGAQFPGRWIGRTERRSWPPFNTHRFFSSVTLWKILPAEKLCSVFPTCHNCTYRYTGLGVDWNGISLRCLPGSHGA